MYNAIGKVIFTKTGIFVSLEVISFILFVKMCVLFAAPTPKKYFPEQTLPPVFQLTDGQTYGDKLLVMRVLHSLERHAMQKYGNNKWVPFNKDYVFEGDIILQKEQAMVLVAKLKRRTKRKMDAEVTSQSASKKWPLPINYIFDGSHNATQRLAIRRGIAHWEEETCVTFTNNQSSHAKSIKFINNEGCYSYVGNTATSEHQNISIGATCTRKGVVAHEIGHALGFWHEHAREDRDDHLTVVWKNIMFGQYHNFAQESWENINNLAVPYDLGSVMHYSGHQFAKYMKATMQTLNPMLQLTIGQREELSFYDVKLANLAYCKDQCTGSELNGTCLHDGYQDPKNCSRCRCPKGLAGDFCDTVAPSNRQCGGVIELSPDKNNVTTITSPHIYVAAGPGVECYWLLKSPEGTSISMRFRQPLMHSLVCDPEQPYLPCRDFVEIRFTDNLGVTGGRFCCDDSLQREMLSHTIVSHNNHALVLFKTVVGVTQGFQLDAAIEGCGGCYNTISESQISCIRKSTKPCKQSWQKVTKMKCIFRFWGCFTQYRLKTVERLTQCYTEEPFCCHGYELSTDSQTCTKIHVEDDGTMSETTSTENTAPSETTYSNRDVNTWSVWSGWSDCSVTCGGCGQTIRTRSCPEGGSCSGETQETSTCGSDRCQLGIAVKTCSKTHQTSYSCGFNFFGGGGSTCYRSVVAYYTQTASCCCGHYIEDEQCVKNFEQRR